MQIPRFIVEKMMMIMILIIRELKPMQYDYDFCIPDKSLSRIKMLRATMED